MQEDLYELIGGRKVITKATELFYSRVLQDERLRHFFEGVEIENLRSRQVMFISMLLGGSVYTGKDISEAHAHARHRGLNDLHFSLFLEHFRAALQQAGVKPENAEKLMHRLEQKRDHILDA